jgi:hypothetical protein
MPRRGRPVVDSHGPPGPRRDPAARGRLIGPERLVISGPVQTAEFKPGALFDPAT